MNKLFNEIPVNFRSYVFQITILLFALCATGAQNIVKADAVTDWNAISFTAGVNAGRGQAPIFIDQAYMHIAIYDAVNAIDGWYSVFAVSPSNVPPHTSKETATVAAAYTVLRSFYPTQQAYLDAQYAASLAAIPDGPSKTNGINVGTEVANLFLASRMGDSRNAPIVYTPGSGPGAWIPTPPAFAAAAFPWIAQMRPFGIESPSQFRADGVAMGKKGARFVTKNYFRPVDEDDDDD